MLSKSQKSGHLAVARTHWEDLCHTLKTNKVVIDGRSLTIADVVAASEYVLHTLSNPANDRHGCHPYLTRDSETLDSILRSVETLHRLLAAGHEIYGNRTSNQSRSHALRSQHRLWRQRRLSNEPLCVPPAGSPAAAAQRHPNPGGYRERRHAVFSTVHARCMGQGRHGGALELAVPRPLGCLGGVHRGPPAPGPV